MAVNTHAKGNRFELDVWGDLEDKGWLCGSRRKGRRPKNVDQEQPGDLTAQKNGERPLLVECKATKNGPFENFRPHDRAEIRRIAREAGMVPMLAWKKPRQVEPVYLDEVEWP